MLLNDILRIQDCSSRKERLDDVFTLPGVFVVEEGERGFRGAEGVVDFGLFVPAVEVVVDVVVGFGSAEGELGVVRDTFPWGEENFKKKESHLLGSDSDDWAFRTSVS